MSRQETARPHIISVTGGGDRGITVDKGLAFSHHVTLAAEKLIETVAALETLKLNIGGSKINKRQLLRTVAYSTMLYGPSVWEGALKVARNRNRLATVQRKMELRSSSAYRTISREAALVTAGTPSIELMAIARRGTL
ncbi:hypothetical protein NQ314_012239 [Rhamnusium bicolor]|uniref:Uncharacterized protein n=1 Tax=Rhamnusium bicolor TaxID=1586634 RepID=A0AAV8XDQ5_9CUCU|nr:hypothetical protein NQ314_012239 [Rhamnusium bicolor]